MNPITAGGNASAGLMRTIANLQMTVMQKLISDATQNSPASQASKPLSSHGLTAKELLATGKAVYL